MFIIVEIFSEENFDLHAPIWSFMALSPFQLLVKTALTCCNIHSKTVSILNFI